MKFTLTLLASALVATSGLSRAEEYKTLNGYRESYTISANQTVMIVSATESSILEVAKPGLYPQQFEFYRLNEHCDTCQHFSGRSARLRLPVPSFSNPTPIAGPAVITLRTNGLVTLTVPTPERRGYLSTSSGPRAFATK